MGIVIGLVVGLIFRWTAGGAAASAFIAAIAGAAVFALHPMVLILDVAAGLFGFLIGSLLGSALAFVRVRKARKLAAKNPRGGLRWDLD